MSSSKLYYLYVGASAFAMATTFTTYAPFLQSIGFSLGEISLLNSIFWLVIILGELPTGMLADGKSRAWSIQTGLLFQTIGSLFYLFASGFWSALCGEALIGIGMAFVSGADTAWITDALAHERRGLEYRKVFATATVVKGAAILLGGFVGSLLSLIHPSLIWAPMAFVAPIIVLFARLCMNGQGEPVHRVSEWSALTMSWNLLRTSQALKWVVVCTILLGTVVSFNHFWSPYFKSMVGTVGLSAVWAMMYLSVTISALFVRKMPISQGDEARGILVSMMLTACGMIIAGFASGLWIPLSGVMIHEFGRGIQDPLISSFVQHRVDSSFRATFGSLQSLLSRVGYLITPLIIWASIQQEPDSASTIQWVWLMCGIILLLGTGVLYFFRPQSSNN